MYLSQSVKESPLEMDLENGCIAVSRKSIVLTSVSLKVVGMTLTCDELKYCMKGLFVLYNLINF